MGLVTYGQSYGRRGQMGVNKRVCESHTLSTRTLMSSGTKNCPVCAIWPEMKVPLGSISHLGWIRA